MLTALEDASVPQPERQQLLALAAKVLGCRGAGANQVAQRRHLRAAATAGARSR
jgi:hypothetical protein